MSRDEIYQDLAKNYEELFDLVESVLYTRENGSLVELNEKLEDLNSYVATEKDD